jgi:hypothetical protein
MLAGSAVTNYDKQTYSCVAWLLTFDADNLCDGLVLLCRVVNKLRLHDCVVLKIGWLVCTFVERLRLGRKTGHAVSLAENNLAGNTLDVATVA